jgi:hypothetical protein
MKKYLFLFIKYTLFLLWAPFAIILITYRAIKENFFTPKNKK